MYFRLYFYGTAHERISVPQLLNYHRFLVFLTKATTGDVFLLLLIDVWISYIEGGAILLPILL